MDPSHHVVVVPDPPNEEEEHEDIAHRIVLPEDVVEITSEMTVSVFISFSPL